jgi:hypothetical protein
MSPSTMQDLESKGEIEVTKLLAQGEYGEPSSRLFQDVETWLKSKEKEANKRAEDRSIEALNSSKQATRIAIFAVCLSVIMAIKEIIDWYSKSR